MHIWQISKSATASTWPIISNQYLWRIQVRGETILSTRNLSWTPLAKRKNRSSHITPTGMITSDLWPRQKWDPSKIWVKNLIVIPIMLKLLWIRPLKTKASTKNTRIEVSFRGSLASTIMSTNWIISRILRGRQVPAYVRVAEKQKNASKRSSHSWTSRSKSRGPAKLRMLGKGWKWKKMGGTTKWLLIWMLVKLMRFFLIKLSIKPNNSKIKKFFFRRKLASISKKCSKWCKRRMCRRKNWSWRSLNLG